MRKKILSATFVVAIMAVAGYNVFLAKEKDSMHELALANVEALADDSEPQKGDPCYTGAYDSTKPEATKCANPCSKERCAGNTDVCY